MNEPTDFNPANDLPIPLGEPAHAAGFGAVPPEATLTLSLDDLIPDARGEVVILDQAGHDIALVTDQPVAGQGVEALHVMASGLDVSGFHYCSFAGGITIFYPATHSFLVTDQT